MIISDEGYSRNGSCTVYTKGHIYNNKKFETLYVQWNLSKSNLFETSICVRNRQVFDLYRLN